MDVRSSLGLDFDDAVLARYLAGEATEAEHARVQAWAASDERNSTVLTALERAWRLEMSALPSFDVERMIGRVLHDVPREDVRATPRVADGTSATSFNLGLLLRPSLRRVSWIVVATVASIGIAITTLWSSSRHSDRTDAVTTYTTAKGERANITLPDGTHVILNVASRIEVPSHFGERNRRVYLTGEASFAVAHTTGVPFVVTAGKTSTTVLGTEFEIRAYDTTNVRVAVRSGRVMVHNVVLGGHDWAYVSSEGVRVEHNQSVEPAFAFTLGRLVITNRPLREAIDALDRWYDVDIRLGDPSLGDAHLDAVLVSGSTSDLMEWLRKALDLRIVRNGRILTLYSR
jgi:ferric-dicitrate binding protein FerR (iron transport regulator)